MFESREGFIEYLDTTPFSHLLGRMNPRPDDVTAVLKVLVELPTTYGLCEALRHFKLTQLDLDFVQLSMRRRRHTSSQTWTVSLPNLFKSRVSPTAFRKLRFAGFQLGAILRNEWLRLTEPTDPFRRTLENSRYFGQKKFLT